MRAVLDTNLLISYLLTQGETLSRIIDHWEQGHFVYVDTNG
jgi:predicted nucleic acid-binding protein